MILITLALAALVQTTPVDCTDADHRAFDFWLGDWTVTAVASGTVVADSRIEPVADGCAVQETYHQTVGPGGTPTDYRGHSYSAFDAIDGVWRQFYVDSTGSVSTFAGESVDGAMVLIAERGEVWQRMTVAPADDGAVRQTGEVSRDGGETWSTGYEFLYRPR
ncbi:hypothetical protein [uncultured Brevundimonas sp.]|uniref:hypothetical protein n=1 Tax=uncultured Brevundimonas sp. TaxID=213418 RepID=UPI0030ECAF0A|tara:strand:+ start:46268 stop:46756 length:489 start_codon:yes stop_codon:yes gene_type:complete